MTDLTITVHMPSVEVNCPTCDASLEVPGDEFKTFTFNLIYFAKATLTCDHCETEFTVLIGD